MNELSEDYYVFVQPKVNPKGLQFVKVIDGPLSGAVLHIRKVSFETPKKTNGFTPKVNIDYKFIEYPEEDINGLSDAEISNIIGLIVEDIIRRYPNM